MTAEIMSSLRQHHPLPGRILTTLQRNPSHNFT